MIGRRICPKCGNTEAVFFSPDDEKMQLRGICCSPACKHTWIRKMEDGAMEDDVEVEVETEAAAEAEAAY